MSLLRFFRRLRTAPFFFFPLLAVQAGNLEWRHLRVDQAATLDQEKAEAAFHFKNNGTQTIAIVDVRTSCGCTTATLDKRVYAAGEEGEIKAVFNLAGRSGTQEKVIEVLTDDRPDQPTHLVFSVSIPEAFTIEPRLLLWKKAEAGTVIAEKSALLTAAPGVKLSVRSVQSENPNFEVRWVAEQEGQRFAIMLKPVQATNESRTTVRIQLEGPAGRTRTTSVYGIIK